MEKFNLHVLGCGSAQPTLRHHQTSQVLNIHEKLFMIDCGEGTQQQLRTTHLSFSRLNHIFISHLHGDHCFGLIGLISTFSLLGRTKSCRWQVFVRPRPPKGCRWGRRKDLIGLYGFVFLCVASRFAEPRSSLRKVLIVAVGRCHCGALIRGLQNLGAPCERSTGCHFLRCAKSNQKAHGAKPCDPRFKSPVDTWLLLK